MKTRRKGMNDASATRAPTADEAIAEIRAVAAPGGWNYGPAALAVIAEVERLRAVETALRAEFAEVLVSNIADAVREAVAKEREACARLCDEAEQDLGRSAVSRATAAGMAERIRLRGVQ